MFKNDKRLLWVKRSQQMSVAACYLCRAEGEEHAAVITLRDRGEGEGGMLQVGNDRNQVEIRI